VQVIVYPLGIPALYAWHLHRNRDKIDPDLPPIENETPEELQNRKIKAREADKSLRHLHFLFEERAPAPVDSTSPASRAHPRYLPCYYLFIVFDSIRKLSRTA